MKVLVIGAGMMGSAIAFDLAQSKMFEQVLISDIDFEKALLVVDKIKNNVKPVQLDVNDYDKVVKVLSGVDIAISAVPYSFNYLLTEAAIKAKKHFLDLGGNNEVLRKQMLLTEEAEEAKVSIIPNCGLAPGLVNILAVGGAKEFDTLYEIYLRVGGLPLHPKPPLNYQIVFSVEGLLNEYTQPVEVIRNARIEYVKPMEDIEEIKFPEPFGTLEAFNTSGGISNLCQYFAGRVWEMDYKTIRYKGHCEKFKTLLELGFASNEPLILSNNIKTYRDFFIDLLLRKLSYNDEDVVLLRVIINGSTNKQSTTVIYEMTDYYDCKNQISAMMRTTAYPTSIIAQMLVDGRITQRGVVPPEFCTDVDEMISELSKRNINILKKIINEQK